MNAEFPPNAERSHAGPVTFHHKRDARPALAAAIRLGISPIHDELL
ncbi:MAG TPA: hypothetical protein PKI20_16280 [Verrucomicrobiota bacterium]|nr:hypothetical protein [Verrucomicrobiota bacterium]